MSSRKASEAELEAEFRRLCGGEDDTRHLKVGDRCVRAIRQIEVRMCAGMAKHMRIGDRRREAIQKVGEQHTSEALEKLQQYLAHSETDKEVVHWVDTLLLRMGCKDREVFMDKLSEFARVYDVIKQGAGSEEVTVEKALERMAHAHEKIPSLQRNFVILQEQLDRQAKELEELKALRERCARQEQELRELRERPAQSCTPLAAQM
ncbi:hypothetical protein Y032_0047g1499 [Ancylostoma ceylanicum]|uniref:Uncharacterized protein n=1 Tax=Ancylostoma ceylanicum TaxID=53326 RepID=A0A016UD00_9BILA|nr:hypothetical protein Y032_0047g1499 [Ancylostoma ceylanicum]